MLIKKKVNKKKSIALLEITLLVLGTIAFVYVIGVSQVGFVSGEFPGDTDFVSSALGPTNFPSDENIFREIGESLEGEASIVDSAADSEKGKGIFASFSQLLKENPALEALVHASLVGAGVALLAGFIFDGENAGTAGFLAGFAGTLTYKFAFKGFFGKGAFLSQGKALALGAGVGVLVFVLLYKEEEQKIVQYTCYPWDAPVGGENCERCNDQGLPCSEYQCRSLGQACQLLNKEESGEKFCAWVNPGDVEPPIINPWEDALTPDHSYSPDNAISPPDRGVKIISSLTSDGCVQAFTPLSFGITLDEPGRCRLDYTKKRNFTDMQFYFGGSSTFKLNHTQVLSLPGPSALAAENITLQKGGQFEIYTRCMDANGNANEANFLFNFCVEEGPDTTPPLIVTTSILNGFPIAFNQSEIDLTVFINEPAECRWSDRDQRYEDMEHDMSCSSSITEINAQSLYECQTTLEGLRSRQDNNFYFRCKDQPRGIPEGDRNTNQESYKFTLVGTQPLVIDDVGPNGTIRDSTSPVQVTLTAETSAGYKEGEATCYYSDSGNEGSFIQFFETESHEHSQDLFLAPGSYEYFIRCNDLGGNTDQEVVNFNTESDTSAPIVARAYHESNDLVIITNEDASCVYSTQSCNYLYEDGIAMTTFEGNEHITEWNTNINFYIKCQDEFGNQPNPDQCSITARPLELEFEG